MEKIYLVFFLVISYLILNRKKTYFGVDKKVGRGVFCNNIILPGEIVEKCPTLMIDNETFDVDLQNYLFTDGVNNHVGLGIAGLFNHSDTPNIRWYFSEDNEISFIANKLILPNEQLTINYGEEYWPTREEKIKIKI